MLDSVLVHNSNMLLLLLLLRAATRRTRPRPLIRVPIIRNPNSPHLRRRRPAIRTPPPMTPLPPILRLAKLHLIIIADRIQHPTLARRRASPRRRNGTLDTLAVSRRGASSALGSAGPRTRVGRDFAAETAQQRAESGDARDDHAHVYLDDRPLDDCFRLRVSG